MCDFFLWQNIQHFPSDAIGVGHLYCNRLFLLWVYSVSLNSVYTSEVAESCSEFYSFTFYEMWLFAFFNTSSTSYTGKYIEQLSTLHLLTHNFQVFCQMYLHRSWFFMLYTSNGFDHYVNGDSLHIWSLWSPSSCALFHIPYFPFDICEETD